MNILSSTLISGPFDKLLKHPRFDYGVFESMFHPLPFSDQASVMNEALVGNPDITKEENKKLIALLIRYFKTKSNLINIEAIIMEASRLGYVRVLRFMWEDLPWTRVEQYKGSSWRERFEKQYTPVSSMIKVAIRAGKVGVINYYITERQWDPSQNENQALRIAIYNNSHFVMLKLLSDERVATTISTANLGSCFYNDNLRAFKILLRYFKISVSSYNYLAAEAVSSDSVLCLKYVLKNKPFFFSQLLFIGESTVSSETLLESALYRYLTKWNSANVILDQVDLTLNFEVITLMVYFLLHKIEENKGIQLIVFSKLVQMMKATKYTLDEEILEAMKDKAISRNLKEAYNLLIQ